MIDYPKDEQGRKKALAAQESFCKQVHDAGSTQTYSKAEEFAARTTVKDTKSVIETLIKQRQVKPRAVEFLHNANWHLTQALKIIDEVK